TGSIFQFGLNGLQLLLGELALQLGKALLGLQLRQAVLQSIYLFAGFVLCLLGFDSGVRGVSGGFSSLGTASGVEKGEGDLDSYVKVIVLEPPVIILIVVEFGIAVVFHAESELGAIILSGVPKGELQLRPGIGDRCLDSLVRLDSLCELTIAGKFGS